jgi:hypothetical protein
MEFGNLKTLGPLVLELFGSSSIGMYLGHLIGTRPDDMIIGAACAVLACGLLHRYVWRKYKNNLTEIYSRLYNSYRNKRI